MGRALMLMHRDLTVEAIADVLRSGEADQSFLNALAMMLDPVKGKHPPPWRLTLKHAKAQRPRGKKKFDEAALVAEVRALEARGLSRGEEKPLREDILDKHRISERTAREAVAKASADDQFEAQLAALDDLLEAWLAARDQDLAKK